MIVNIIVICVSLIVAGFLLLRLFVPGARDWFEAPKYRFMRDNAEQSDCDDSKG